MSIADKLTSILDSKTAIKEALLEKGVPEVSDVLSDYPGYILNIPSGGDSPVPDIPIPEWTYPENWIDMEQVLNDNVIEGYPYRIAQLLGPGTSVKSSIISISQDPSTSQLLDITVPVRFSDGGYYELTNGGGATEHTWTCGKDEYRWIIYYYNVEEFKLTPYISWDCIYCVIDGLKLYGITGTSSENQVQKPNYSQYSFSFRRLLECIKGINSAELVTVGNDSFTNCNSLYKIDIPIGSFTGCSSVFSSCNRLQKVPEIKTSTEDIKRFDSIFYGCSSLKEIPETIKTDNGTSFFNMFDGCSSLKEIPETIKTDNGNGFSSMFSGCSLLKEIPESIKTDNGTNFNNMFNGCSSLKEIPESIKTDNGTNIDSMFTYCSSLREIPETIKTDKCSSLAGVFNGCYNLVTIPETFKTSHITSFSMTFNYCNSLRELPNNFDTSSSTNFSSIFGGCNSLREIPSLNVYKSTAYSFSSGSLPSGGNLIKLKNFILNPSISYPSLPNSRYLTDLSMDISGCTQSQLTTMPNSLPSLTNFESLGSIDVAMNFSKCPYLTHASLMSILNSLSEVTTTLKLTLGEINLAKLTEEEIAIGTSKGWSIIA